MIVAGLCTSLAGAAFANVDEGLVLLQQGDASGASAQFAAAFEGGDAAGAFWLGRMFELGIGAAPDPMRAANLYGAAAEGGDPAGQLRLGLMYHEGTVLLRDYVEGSRLICAAAEGGLSDAQVACGLAHEAGRGVDTDSALAQQLWATAAGAGNVAAMNLLGAAALRSEDVAGAREWFAQSADAGNAVGMVETARLLEAADEPDLIEAYALASLAVVRAHPDAGVLRDRIESQLSAAEVTQAQARAREWTQAQMQAAD
jgi:TPR repeat protein